MLGSARPSINGSSTEGEGQRAAAALEPQQTDKMK